MREEMSPEGTITKGEVVKDTQAERLNSGIPTY